MRLETIQGTGVDLNAQRRHYRRQGYDEEWIEKRLQSILVCNELTAEWDQRGAENEEYPILTNDIAAGTFGKTTRQHLTFKWSGLRTRQRGDEKEASIQEQETNLHPSYEERRTIEEITRTMERSTAQERSQEQTCSLDEIGHQRGETRAARGTHSGSGRMAPDPGRGHGGRHEKPLRGTRVGSRSREPMADARDTLLEAEALRHSLHRGGDAVGEPPDHGARSGVGGAHGSGKPARNRAESWSGTHGSPSGAGGT
jgi:hypothetical protein